MIVVWYCGYHMVCLFDREMTVVWTTDICTMQWGRGEKLVSLSSFVCSFQPREFTWLWKRARLITQLLDNALLWLQSWFCQARLSKEVNGPKSITLAEKVTLPYGRNKKEEMGLQKPSPNRIWSFLVGIGITFLSLILP